MCCKKIKVLGQISIEQTVQIQIRLLLKELCVILSVYFGCITTMLTLKRQAKIAATLYFFIFIFQRKKGLMFQVNPLPSRGFTWNIKSDFLWKAMKKYLRMFFAAVLIGALRVKCWDRLSIEQTKQSQIRLLLKELFVILSVYFGWITTMLNKSDLFIRQFQKSF